MSFFFCRVNTGNTALVHTFLLLLVTSQAKEEYFVSSKNEYCLNETIMCVDGQVKHFIDYQSEVDTDKLTAEANSKMTFYITH